MVMQKQGIVTNLGSESNRNGFQSGLSSSPMKKTDSFKKLSHLKVTSELDIWSLILNQKNKDEASKIKSLPYIHPLEKKSKNCLSEKSLKICTESLGSETGSDGFYSFTSSEDNSEDDEKENVKTCDDENPKCYYSTKKPHYFPPPLPSLTSQSQPLQIRSHRDNGRLFLFLQVVSVPSHNNFFATRQNDRLILTFTNNDKEIADEFEEDESVIEQTQMLSSEITHVGSLELVVNKAIGLVNKSPKLSEKFNKVTNFEDVKVVQHGSLPRSLPMINGYQCYWRTKATGNVAPLIPNDQQYSISNKVVVSRNMNTYQASNEASQDLQQLFDLSGKNKDYLIHNLRFCKDSRATRSFLFWNSCFIAT